MKVCSCPILASDLVNMLSKTVAWDSMSVLDSECISHWQLWRSLPTIKTLEQYNMINRQSHILVQLGNWTRMCVITYTYISRLKIFMDFIGLSMATKKFSREIPSS